MKILLIEDDRIIGENIGEYLKQNNFLVTHVLDFEKANFEILNNKYDLIIFDLMLGNKSGFDLIKNLNDNNIKIPFLILTAKEDIESKEKGFLMGAYDYITKPFSLKELVLRIRNILDRNNYNINFNIINLGEFELNQDLKELKREGKSILLTPKEYQIIEYLMINNTKVIKKTELLEYLWGINNDIRSDVIRTHINSLRNKINDGFSYDPIKTIRGIGFKFTYNED